MKNTPQINSIPTSDPNLFELLEGICAATNQLISVAASYGLEYDLKINKLVGTRKEEFESSQHTISAWWESDTSHIPSMLYNIAMRQGYKISEIKGIVANIEGSLSLEMLDGNLHQIKIPTELFLWVLDEINKYK